MWIINNGEWKNVRDDSDEAKKAKESMKLDKKKKIDEEEVELSKKRPSGRKVKKIAKPEGKPKKPAKKSR